MRAGRSITTVPRLDSRKAFSIQRPICLPYGGLHHTAPAVSGTHERVNAFVNAGSKYSIPSRGRLLTEAHTSSVKRKWRSSIAKS